jgi:hypothetical protein
VKLDADTPSTVPDDPPAAGPDRAFDPAPPEPRPPAAPPACPDVAEEDAAVADGDEVAKPTETPITAHTSTEQTANIHRPFLFDSNRRSHGMRLVGWYSYIMALLVLGSYAF